MKCLLDIDACVFVLRGDAFVRQYLDATDQMALTERTFSPQHDTIEAWRRRIGRLDPCQIVAWRAMTPAQRLDLACQAYQLALDVVRLTERRNHPDLSPEELAWRVTRRMQGDRSLGRERDGTRPSE